MIEKRLNEWVSREYEWLKGEIGTNITWGKMSEYTEDLLHHIILDLYKMDPEKIEGLLDNGKLKYYVLRGASLQIRSQTSPFYKIWRKTKMQARSGVIDSDNGETNTPSYELNIEPEEQLIECLDRAVEQLHWYEQALYDKKFKQGWTLEEIHKFYGIGKRHLIRDLNNALDKIRKQCKNAK